MKVAIVGIGGIGGYYGGRLARYYAVRDDIEVIFIARGEHLKEIQKNGLKQLTEEGTFTAIPDKATDDPAACGRFDVVLFCVKTYDLEAGASLLKDSIDARTVVISLLNGVDNAERLEAVLPGAHILNGCVYISAHIVRPGVVRQAGGSCKLFFGPDNRAQKNYRAVERLLKDAGIAAEYSENIKAVVWEKFIFIAALASATTYLGKTFGELTDDSQSEALLNGLLEEVERVGRAQGVDFAEDIRKTTLEKITLFPYDTKTSMQMDFEKGKKTELETFTGYMVRFAERHGISAPLHATVYDALLKRSAAWK
ncbi:MAG: 2-dehydropantoate 2-reductase [Proteobacteria bacterium]|nr:2-dehydropantoate 2-reductase [Pseudomonadota bacterium]